MNEELKIIINVAADPAKKALQGVKKELKGINSQGDESGKAVDKAMLAIAKGAKIAIAAIAALGTAMTLLGKSAQEVEKGFAKLRTTFANAGSSASQANQTYKELFGVIGDHDRTVEAAQSLALITTEEEKLTEWTNILTGAFAEMGDKLPIEGLAEAANETINVGQVTGVLADALTWLGISEDGFNAALANTTSLSEREALVRSTLNALYSNSAQIYKANNQATIAYNKSQADLNLALSNASQYTTPFLTSMNQLGATLLTVLGPALQNVATYFIAFIELIAEAIVWVGNFFGVLSSNTSDTAADIEGYQKAMDDYYAALRDAFGGTNDEIDESIKGIDKLKKATMGFDELNVVSTPTSGGGDTSGGGGGIKLPPMPKPEDYGLTGGDDFLNLDDFLEDIKEAKEELQIFLGILGGIGLAIGGWKLYNFVSDLIEASKTSKELKDVYEQLKDTLDPVSKEFGMMSDEMKEVKKQADEAQSKVDKFKNYAGMFLMIAGAITFAWGAADALINGLDWGNFTAILLGLAAIVGGIALKFGGMATPIALIVAGIAALVLGIIDLVNNGYSMEAVIMVAVGAIAVLIGVVWALNSALLANPITWIVAAIIALVAVFVILWNECEGFRNFWINLWEGIKKVFTVVCDAIVKFFTQTIPETFKKIMEWLKTNVAEPIAQFYNKWIKPVVDKLIEIVMKLVEMVVALFVGLWNLLNEKVITPIVNGFKYVWEKVSSFFTSLWEDIKKIWEAIKEVFSPVVSWFSDKFKAAWQAVKDVFKTWGSFFSGLWDTIKKTFSKLGTSIGNAIGDAVKSGINGIIILIEKTINKAIKLINGGIDLINLLPGVKVEKIGLLTMPRLAKGGITTGPTTALIGEAGREAVLPLENNTEWMNILADKIANRSNTPSKIVLMLDSKELGWANINSINSITKQTGNLQLVLA